MRKKSNKKSIKKWGQYVLLAAFIGLLFTTDLKAEVFGFVQRGMLQLGLFQPETEQVVKKQKPKEKEARTGYEMRLKDQNGKTVSLSQLDDKVVFINFWATWCPPCVAEMPNINKLYQHYEDDDEVVFLMVSLDKKFSKAKGFLEKKAFDFDVFKPQGSMPNDFKSSSIPTTYVLDKNGEIAFSHLGMGNYNTRQFKKFINDLK